MTARPHRALHVVQVNLQSDRGGDGRIVAGLHDEYRALGYRASLVIGRGSLPPTGGTLLPNDDYRSRWARVWLRSGGGRFTIKEASRHSKLFSWIAEPVRRRRVRRGFEDCQFPGTLPVISRLLRGDPSVLHLHNLHGGYFDLRALPDLSHLAPIILTLHDQWTFTGHCAHSFECERWRLGCGQCPDLSIYPGIPRDRTAENFTAKAGIFARTRLHLTTPCKWLMDKAENSLLTPAIEEARIIPNGVDTHVFRPGDRLKERNRLGLPAKPPIVLCSERAARSDHWADRPLLHSTLRYLAENGPANCTVLFMGSERNADEQIEGIPVLHRAYEGDMARVAAYYRASDVYMHLARADTFPTAILESLACGIPVVATAVGGIPEQIESLWASKNASVGSSKSATGVLVDREDSTGAGRAIEELLLNKELRGRVGENAFNSAGSRFSITRQAQNYLDWYGEVLDRRASTRSLA